MRASILVAWIILLKPGCGRRSPTDDRRVGRLPCRNRLSRGGGSLKSANLPDGRRAKAAIRLENHPFARVWAEEGLQAVRKVAKKSPEAFVAIAARICPNDARLTLEQAIPGGMSLEDYSLLRSDCGDQGRLARCRPITARCGIPTCAGGVARLSEEPADRCVDYR